MVKLYSQSLSASLSYVNQFQTLTWPPCRLHRGTLSFGSSSWSLAVPCFQARCCTSYAWITPRALMSFPNQPAFGNPTIDSMHHQNVQRNQQILLQTNTNNMNIVEINSALVSPLCPGTLGVRISASPAFWAWQVHVGAKGEWTPTPLRRSRSDCSRTAFSSQDFQTTVGMSCLKQTPPFQIGSGTNRLPFQNGPQGNGPGSQQTRMQCIQEAALVRQSLISLLQHPKRRRHLTTELSSPCANPPTKAVHILRPKHLHPSCSRGHLEHPHPALPRPKVLQQMVFLQQRVLKRTALEIPRVGPRLVARIWDPMAVEVLRV